MGLLDRFKPQPRWKHADPAVRLAAVAELVDAAELAALAEADPDAAVRAAAVAKVADLAVLGRVAASDADQGLRDAAADRVLEFALDESNPDAAKAAALLSDVRRVSLVARSTAADDVRAIALAALTNERALAGVARQAKVEATALAALARLETAEEILGTALNSEHAAVATAAFDRVLEQEGAAADVALLKSVAARAQQKPVARRAKAMLQAIEDAEQARRAAEEEQRNQEIRLFTAAEGLAPISDPDRIDAELARLQAAWNVLKDTDAHAAKRFVAAVEAARAQAARRREEIAAALAEEKRRLEALAGREELCRRIEAVDGEDAAEQLQALEQEWSGLAPVAGYEREVQQFTTRFQVAAKSCRARLAREAALAEDLARLEALVVEAEAVAAGEQPDAADRCRELAREGRALAARLADASRPAADLAERLEAVLQVFEARDQAAREAEARARQKQDEKLEQMAVRAARAVEKGEFTLREGEKLLRDVTTALEQAGEAGKPSEGSRKAAEAVAALRVLHDPIATRVKELRDLDKWRRFANAQRQEEIIEAAEALVAWMKAADEAGVPSDLAAAAHALRDFQAWWKEVPDAPEQSAQRLWNRFRAATEFIRGACEGYFAQVRQERKANLAAKTELVEQAEALAESTDWIKTADRLRELQKAWDATGPAPGDAARSLAQRFRAACNTFFTRRRDDLNSRKAEWAVNMAAKVALCERAEELAQSSDWDSAADAIKRLQVEWKGVGPVQHAKGEALWKRFRAAADLFFERYHKRHEAAAAAKLAEHEALVVSLEALAALEEAPDDLAQQVQALRTAIANAPQVDGAAAAALYSRWTTALVALASRWPASFRGTDLDFPATRERLERLVAKVESFVTEEKPAAAAAGQSSAALLAERLRSALEGNALGARSDEKKWRAAGSAVEDAQATWHRLVWLPGQVDKELEARFEKACRQVRAQVKRHGGAPAGGAREEAPRHRRPPR